MNASSPTDPRSRRRPSTGLVPVSALLAVVAIAHAPILRLWWTYDDFFHLHYLLQHRSVDYLLKPAVWQELPFKMLTPLLMLSLDADLHVFGLQPRAFYLHHLIALLLASGVIYGIFTLWLRRWPSVLAALLVMSGMPMVEITQQLMLRHYLEGLVWAGAMIWFYVTGCRRNTQGRSIGSAVFYLLAALSKEIFVPLPLLLPFMGDGPLRGRLRHVAPHALVGVAYIAWRHSMLGTLIGGYGWVVRASDLPGLVVSLPARLVTALFGESFFSGAIAGGVMLICAAYAASRSRKTAAFMLVALLVVIAPVIPVAKVLEHRYVLGLWLVLSAATAFTLLSHRELNRNRTARLAGGLLLLLFAAMNNRAGWNVLYADASRMSTEGRFFLSMNGGEWIRQPMIPPAAMGELKWMKERHLKLPSGASWFYDDVALCDGVTRGAKKVWEYRAGGVEEISGRLPLVAREYCSSILTAPLSVRLHYTRSEVAWSLGPYRDGKYYFVFQNGIQAFQMPQRDRFYVGALPALSVRVRYESPDGWNTYSPELTMDFSRQRELVWSRR